MGGNKPVILELRPPDGVHPVRIGMTREDAGLALTELGTPVPFARGHREPVGWKVAEGESIPSRAMKYGLRMMAGWRTHT